MSNEYGVFEKLPKNYSSSKALIQDIQTLIKNNFGWLGYHYLSKMVHKLNSDKADEFRATVNEYIQDFESKCDLGCKQGYGQRFLHRFAIIYASFTPLTAIPIRLPLHKYRRHKIRKQQFLCFFLIILR